MSVGLPRDNWVHAEIKILPSETNFVHVHSVHIKGGIGAEARPFSCYRIRMSSFASKSRALFRKHVDAADKDAISLEIPVTSKSNKYHSNSWFKLEVEQFNGSPVEEFAFGLPPDQSGQVFTGAKRLESLPTRLDALRYIASYSDLSNLFGPDEIAGRNHYKQYGRREGRTVTFDPLRYVGSHPDLFFLGINQESICEHYIKVGSKENRGSWFDPWLYLASNRHLLKALSPNETEATKHFIETGFVSGLRWDTFDWQKYRDQHPNVRVPSNATDVARYFVLHEK